MEHTLTMMAMKRKQFKDDEAKSTISTYNKHDPKLIKLMELIYANIRKRF